MFILGHTRKEEVEVEVKGGGSLCLLHGMFPPSPGHIYPGELMPRFASDIGNIKGWKHGNREGEGV